MSQPAPYRPQYSLRRMFRWMLIVCIALAVGRWVYVRTYLQAHVVTQLKSIEAEAEYCGHYRPAASGGGPTWIGSMHDSKFGHVVVSVRLHVPFRSDKETEWVIGLLQQLPHLAEVSVDTAFHSHGTLPEKQQSDRHLAQLIRGLALRGVVIRTQVAGQQTAEAIRDVPSITTVTFDIGAVPTSEQLATICQARHVERMAFNGGELTAEHLRTLSAAGQLRGLSLRCKYPAEALALLGNLSACELRLSGYRLSDHDLQYCVAPLPNLTELDLILEAPSEEALQALAQARGLKWLQLQDASVDDRSIAPLADLPALEFINVCGTHVTEAGLAPFARCRSLKTLIYSDSLDRQRVRDLLPNVRDLQAGEVRPQHTKRRDERKAEADLARQQLAAEAKTP